MFRDNSWWTILTILVLSSCARVGQVSGYSDSIKESKERGVFLTDKFIVVQNSAPDSLLSIRGIFLEKAWNYGRRHKETITSFAHQDFPYQLIIEIDSNSNTIRYGDNWMIDNFGRYGGRTIVKHLKELPNSDTLTYFITEGLWSPEIDRDTIGKLLIFPTGESFSHLN